MQISFVVKLSVILFLRETAKLALSIIYTNEPNYVALHDGCVAAKREIQTDLIKKNQ